MDEGVWVVHELTEVERTALVQGVGRMVLYGETLFWRGWEVWLVVDPRLGFRVETGGVLAPGELEKWAVVVPQNRPIAGVAQ